MFVNLAKSSIIIPLLRQLIDALQHLSSSNINLERLTNQLSLLLEYPHNANAIAMRQVLEQIQEILVSYGVKHNHPLSEMLFVIHSELEDLLTKVQLANATKGQGTSGSNVVASLAIAFEKAARRS